MNKRNYWHTLNHFATLDRRFKGNKDVGWVYVLRNPNHKRPMFKVGETSRDPFARAQELSTSTGVPVPYQVVYFIAVRNRRAAEGFVHSQLQRYRVSNSKEFFEAPLKEIIKAMDLAVTYFADIFLLQPFEATTVACRNCGSMNRVKPIGIPVLLKCHNCGVHIEAP